ncbi:succinyl-diaminopimelate desuccinylase [Nocardia tenerifensis]|uniref:Succinyl-diaminopimelate desuccinylase n=1 Tax=Nocardia tenerifensis TaxID=228006 RepID=A0A318K9F2_9NOCA|nr:M20/M25/M40 family metallo-hydrolase [Nocardia tenerifensis]PXX69354.1 succinyl-diaminopimelate desuccinylase [Nocardia tenerifensis]
MTSSATGPDTEVTPVRRQSQREVPSVIALARDLVRIPSRGGIDDPEPILASVEQWLHDRAVPHRRLYTPDGAPAAVLVEITGGSSGPTWVLDACLDTAPFGDESGWSFSPTAADVSPTGMLRGRGAADSKIAASMFCHLAAAIRRQAPELTGSLAILLDVDEHTGNFSGAKAFLDAVDSSIIAGAMIGYPGDNEVVIGGRGVFRARLHTYGTAGHTGSSKPTIANAATRAARLATLLADLVLPRPAVGGFPLPPKLTVTEIHSGAGFTAVPDHAIVSVDIRLTDVLAAVDAEELLSKTISQLDTTYPALRPSEIESVLSWPHYQLSPTDQPAAALIEGAHLAGFSVRPKVAGPSNIGNLFATRDIPTTAGFGLPYTGLHGTDEQVDLERLADIQAAYHHAVLTLMRTGH